MIIIRNKCNFNQACILVIPPFPTRNLSPEKEGAVLCDGPVKPRGEQSVSWWPWWPVSNVLKYTARVGHPHTGREWNLFAHSPNLFGDTVYQASHWLMTWPCFYLQGLGRGTRSLTWRLGRERQGRPHRRAGSAGRRLPGGPRSPAAGPGGQLQQQQFGSNSEPVRVEEADPEEVLCRYNPSHF